MINTNDFHTSCKISLLGPRNKIVQALGFLHSVMKQKYLRNGINLFLKLEYALLKKCAFNRVRGTGHDPVNSSTWLCLRNAIPHNLRAILSKNNSIPCSSVKMFRSRHY